VLRARLAPSPHSAVLADLGAAARLAHAPLPAMFADRGATARLALAPHLAVFAESDGGAAALIAVVQLPVVFAVPASPRPDSKHGRTRAPMRVRVARARDARTLARAIQS
jgi:hypothetical protein